MKTQIIPIPTNFGACHLLWKQGEVQAFFLPFSSTKKGLQQIKKKYPEAELVVKIPKEVRASADSIQDYFKGRTSNLKSIPIKTPSEAPFFKKVYQVLRNTKPGEVLSYGELAQRAGSPKASRAVGQAMANNPLPLLIPCHRVIGSTGKLHGFSADGGLSTKQRLLSLEGAKPTSRKG